MKKSTLYLLLLLFIIWIVFAAFICKRCLCGVGGDSISAVEEVKDNVKTMALAGWNIKDGSSHSNTCSERFGFLRSNFRHLAPLSNSFSNCLNETASYLKNNPSRAMTITGYYENSETNTNGFLANLGLDRANNIKSYLSGLGVPSAQMEIAGKLRSSNSWSSDTLTNGIDFSFGSADSSNDRIASIKQRLFGKPLTLYFGTNQDQLNLSAQQRTDFADLIYYLDKVSGSSLSIDGHTDNVGNRAYNVNLSKERAAFVSEYLATNGNISTSKMNTNGFGPDNPIASNATNDGKAKNRRVEVILR